MISYQSIASEYDVQYQKKSKLTYTKFHSQNLQCKRQSQSQTLLRLKILNYPILYHIILALLSFSKTHFFPLLINTGNPYTTGARPFRYFSLQTARDFCTSLGRYVPSVEEIQVFITSSVNLSMSLSVTSHRLATMLGL